MEPRIKLVRPYTCKQSLTLIGILATFFVSFIVGFMGFIVAFLVGWSFVAEPGYEVAFEGLLACCAVPSGLFAGFIVTRSLFFPKSRQ